MTTARDTWYVIRDSSGAYFRAMTNKGWDWTDDLARAHRCYSEKPLDELRPEHFVPEAVREHFPRGCTLHQVVCSMVLVEGEAPTNISGTADRQSHAASEVVVETVQTSPPDGDAER